MANTTVSATTMRIVELRRVGGQLVDQLTSFEWSTRTRSSPQGSMQFHLKIKTVRREIPGSDAVIEQAMSATWQPMDFTGEWQDMWMGAGEAQRTFEEFAKLAGKMGLVRVTIDKHSLVGMITDFEPEYITPGYYRWKFTLSPHQNETVGPFRLRAATLFQRPVPEWLNDLRANQEEMQQISESARLLPVADDSVLNVTGLLQEVVDGVNRIEGIASSGFTENAQQKLLLMATTFRRVSQASANVTRSASRERADLSLAFNGAIEELSFTAWSHNTTFSAWKAFGTARAAELDMLSRATRRPRAVYRPIAGEPIERIAMRFYGSADAWRVIYDANHLDTLVLDGTEELIIPEQGA